MSIDNNTLKQFTDAIAAGHLDADLVTLQNAVAARRDRIKVQRFNENAAQIAPGDEVKITSGIRPRYMIGVHTEVVKVNRKRAVVRMLANHGPRFPQGAEVTVPLTCLERIGRVS